MAKSKVESLPLAKLKAYSAIYNTLLSVLNLITEKNGNIVDEDNHTPLIYNEKVVKRHNIINSNSYIDRRTEIELDLLSGNTKIMEFLFDSYLDNMEVCYLGYGSSFIKGSKKDEIPDKYKWAVVFENDSEEEHEVTSNPYKYKNMGLIELIFKLEEIDMTKEFETLEK